MNITYSLLLATVFPYLSSSFTWNNGSDGCGKPLPFDMSPGGPSRNFTIYSHAGGGTRQYLVYLPEKFSACNDDPAPLILAFHGQTQPTASIEEITGLSTPYFNRHTIVVYPEGLDYKPPGHQWLGDPEAPPSSVVEDRIYTNELLDMLTSSFCVDESRIYATGLSNGGGLVGLLACSPLLNRRIAAFAGVAAAFYTDASLTEPLFGAGCNPELSGKRKAPLMELHGLNDTIIAYDGDNSPAPNTIPLPEWVSAWVEKEGCPNKMPKTEVLDGGNVTRYSWSCDGWKDIFVHYKINHFGHGWPSTVWQGEPFESLRLGPTSWNATSVILDWFSRWRLMGDRQIGD
ncbi:carbohydrate esterase family 1 protein [Zopfia rhizophila CBS 207.26]|uniref:feruloyl esterase n=1 Tax=Zopfia rhizophila CBS 207.26 TaxID=1314779 RepID=A0A6A6EG00_9PEZI|nr:carbohydrate esterase family 1 protein [Zopfia rhizophila CBS 207.26]